MSTRYYIVLPIFFIIVLLESFLPLFTGRKKRLLHGGRNLFQVVINNAAYLLLFSSVTAKVFVYAGEHHVGLLNMVSLSPLGRFFLMLVLFDLWMYIWHRLTHKIGFIWRFHRMHHSDPEMDVTSALRFHVGEIIMSSIARLGIYILLGMTATDIILYETIMLPIIFLQHSNFYLPEKVDRVLRLVIPTPWMHWVHHSDIKQETDSNFGTVFSWWDRIFGTYRIRKDPQNIHYGVDIYKERKWQTLWGMLRTPFV